MVQDADRRVAINAQSLVLLLELDEISHLLYCYPSAMIQVRDRRIF
jgi:hypothetical protein